MKILRISLSDDGMMAKWDAFVASVEGGTPFHTAPWLRALQDCYGFEDMLLCAIDDAGNIQAVLPSFVVRSVIGKKKVISLPFSDYGGGLSRSPQHIPSLEKALLEGTEGIASRYEFRKGGPGLGEEFRGYLAHRLLFDVDLDKAWERIDKRTLRRQVRRSKEMGVQIEKREDHEALAVFNELNKITRLRHGIPYQPMRWFDLIYKNFIKEGRGFILLARHGSAYLAAAVMLLFSGGIFYKYSASERLGTGSISSVPLLVWEAISGAYKEKMRYLDFGRTDISNEGLIRFKEMWGCKGTELVYRYYPRCGSTIVGSHDNMLQAVLRNGWKYAPSFVKEAFARNCYGFLA